MDWFLSIWHLCFLEASVTLPTPLHHPFRDAMDMMLVPRLLNILLCPGCDAVMSLLLLPLNVNSVTTPLRCDQPLTQSDSVGSNIHILILEQKWYVSNIILGNKKMSNFLSKPPIVTSFFLFWVCVVIVADCQCCFRQGFLHDCHCDIARGSMIWWTSDRGVSINIAASRCQE